MKKNSVDFLDEDWLYTLKNVKKNSYSYKDFLDFLASDLNEIEYFGCNCDKTSLIALKDYLVELKQKKDNYDKLISESLSSIQSKNKWVKQIIPDHNLNLNGLVIIGYKTPRYMVGINPKCSKRNQDDYLFMGSTRIYLTSFWHPKDKKLDKLLENSQEELHEINKVAQQLNVIIIKDIKTISDNFQIDSTLYDECKINGRWGTMVRYDKSTDRIESVEPIISKDTFYKMEGIYQEKLSLEESEKLVKKLYIKR